MSYPNTVPFGINPSRPNVPGITDFNARTIQPSSAFSAPLGLALGNGVTPVPFNSNLSTTGLYNGGPNGNRQMGMLFASESVNSRYLLVPDFSADADPNGEYFKQLNEGMLLFAASEADHDPVKYTHGSFGSKVTVAYDLASINQFLYKKNAVYGAMESHDILSMWQPLGVMKNESGQSSFHESRKGLSRIINCVVGHRVKTLNIWGGHIEIGMGLFVICKKTTPANKRKYGDPEPSACWQLIPYVNPNGYQPPPLEALKYEDEKEKVKYGDYIYIGMASEAKSATIVDANDKARLRHLSESHTRLPPLIEVYIAC